MTQRRVQQQGVSLVEAMIVLCVIALVAGISAPSFESVRQRAELSGVAGQIETDVHFARSEAVARNRTLHLTLKEAADGTSCYVVHEGPAPDCSCGQLERAACAGAEGVVRAMVLAGAGRIRVRSNVQTLHFDPLKGTVTPAATLRAEARDGLALHQVVSLVGRVRTCSPQARMAGVPAC